MSRAASRLTVLEQAVRVQDDDLWHAVLPLQEWNLEAIEKMARTALRSDNVMAWCHLQRLPFPLPLPQTDLGVAHENWWHVWALEGQSSLSSAQAWWPVLSQQSKCCDALLENGASTALGLALEKGCLNRALVLLERGADPTALHCGQPLPVVLVNRILQAEQNPQMFQLRMYSGYETVAKIWSSPVFPLLARSLARWSEAFELVGRYSGAAKLHALQEVWSKCRLKYLVALPAHVPSPRHRM